MDVLNEYKEVQAMYPLVKDTDGTQAYQLMQKANSLRATLDEYCVQRQKAVNMAKSYIDIVKARQSIEADPRNSANGNRYAMASDEYKDAVKDYAEVKSNADMYERQIEFLKNVAFQMFSVWDNCKKVGERY